MSGNLQDIAAEMQKELALVKWGAENVTSMDMGVVRWIPAIGAEADAFDTLQRQYDVLLEGYHRQEKAMQVAAASLRATADYEPEDKSRWLKFLADELDPQEPVDEL